MGFKITKDKVNEPDSKYNLTGDEFEEYKGGNHKFKILDDDGGIYLYGVSDDDSDFGPLDLFQPIWGVTEIHYWCEKTKKYRLL